MPEPYRKPLTAMTQTAIDESNLVAHARRELALIGEEPETVAGYLNVIQAFADMGHSGGSASVAIPTLNRLLQFGNLRPLTDDPGEWNHVAEAQAGQDDLWQSARNPEAFSNDGGETYWLLSEGRWEGLGADRHHVQPPRHVSEHVEEPTA
jgi:hypothetical protein